MLLFESGNFQGNFLGAIFKYFYYGMEKKVIFKILTLKDNYPLMESSNAQSCLQRKIKINC